MDLIFGHIEDKVIITHDISYRSHVPRSSSKQISYMFKNNYLRKYMIQLICSAVDFFLYIPNSAFLMSRRRSVVEVSAQNARDVLAFLQ